MSWKNTAEHYGTVAKGFHWLVALIVLGLLLLGFYMVFLEPSPFKLKLYWWHKSFGTLVLMLVALRLLWRITNRLPDHIASHKPWERRLAALIHLFLYIGVILMPLSGWIMSSAGDFGHSFFGLFEMPDLTAKDETLFRQMREVHEIAGFILLGAVGLHGLGAFKHHFIDRDFTLRRMLPGIAPRAGVALAVLAFVVLGGGAAFLGTQFLVREIAAPVSAAAPALTEATPVSQSEGLLPRWEIVPESSRIGFAVEVQGKNFEGQFTDFDGTIFFDPARLEQSAADIKVRITSVTTGSDERDQYIAMPAWLHAAAFPDARFVSKDFQQRSEDRFAVYGDLTLRGVSLPVEMPFTLSVFENEQGVTEAHVNGGFAIDRLAYGIGKNEWANPDLVAHRIRIEISLTARRL